MVGLEKRQIPAKRKSVIAQDKKAPTPDLYGEMYRAAAKLAEYTFAVSEKFPRRAKERIGIGNDIRERSVEACERVIELCCFNPLITAEDRERKLRELTVKLKSLNVLIKISHKHRYITPKVMTRWVRLVNEVDSRVIGLAIWYQREREKLERQAQRAAAKACAKRLPCLS